MKKKSSLSIGILAYNEEDNLKDTIIDLLKVLKKHKIDYEIIIVNDGSIDKTPLIAEKLAKKNIKIRVIHHKINKGVGLAIVNVIRNASKDFLAYIPGDNQFNYENIAEYIKHLGNYDLIVGYISNKENRNIYRRIASYIFISIIKMLFHIDVQYTNGLNFIKTDLIKDMEFTSKGHSISSEIIIKVMKFRKVRYKNVEFKLLKKETDTSTAFKWRSILNSAYYTALLWKNIYINKKNY